VLNFNEEVANGRQFVITGGRPNKSLNPTANSDAFIENAFLIAVVRGGLPQALDAETKLNLMEVL